MITSNIVNKIEALPPLPQTIIDIEEFRKKSDKETFELLEIVEKDALIISTLLKIANSAIFGFRSKVETPSRAINLLGMNFTMTIAIGGVVQNLLITNLEPYGISCNDFMKASNLSSSLANLWLSKVDYDLKNELSLPSLLQEAGKFILADIMISEGKTKEFKLKIDSGVELSIAEKEIIGFNTSEITAKIFRHWKLSEELIKLIENVDDISKCDEEIKQKAQILNVIKTACNVIDPLSKKNIELAIKKSDEYGLNTRELEKAIEKIQDRLLDE